LRTRSTRRLLGVLLFAVGCGTSGGADPAALAGGLGHHGHQGLCDSPHGHFDGPHCGGDGSIADAGPPPECAEGETRDCTTDLPGRCAAGAEACVIGSWGACAPTAVLTYEICNGLDDDCNGIVDDEQFDDMNAHPKCPQF
jgi:hypothetical protein